MRRSFLFLLFLLTTHYFHNAYAEDVSQVAATTAVSTVIREPISLIVKDLYEQLIKKPIQRGIYVIRKILRYRHILRWARMWWVLLSREIVGPNGKIDKKSNEVLRRIWEECAIAIHNNSLNSVEAKPMLILHGILNECKEHYATKLKNDPDMIVQKIDRILKSGIYRYWVVEDYLRIGNSNIFYTKVKPSMVPRVPEKYTLMYVSKYMEEKLKSIEAKKDLDIGKYSVAVKA